MFKTILLFSLLFMVGLHSVDANCASDQRLVSQRDSTYSSADRTIELKQVLDSIFELKKDPTYAAAMESVHQIIESLFHELLRKSKADPQFSIGALNLNEMFLRMRQVTVAENPSNKGIVSNPGRHSDFYIPSQKLAYFNKDALKGPHQALTLLLAHVMLGAAGYYDEHMQLSLALVIAELKFEGVYPDHLGSIDLAKLFPTRQEELRYSLSTVGPAGSKDFDKADNNRILVAGGFTGVGGGGDFRTAALKLAMFEYFPVREEIAEGLSCFSRWTDIHEMLRDLMQVRLEASSKSTVITSRHFADGGLEFVFPARQAESAETVNELAIKLLVRLCWSAREGL